MIWSKQIAFFAIAHNEKTAPCIVPRVLCIAIRPVAIYAIAQNICK